jgi:deoxyribonuclease IV
MNNKIRFGPAGLGPVKEAVSNIKEFSKNGLKACEIAFTYGAYIKNESDMKEIKKVAEDNDILLSIHAPYFINLNSKEKKKIEESKERILKCCEIGEKLGAYVVVFHSGFYGGMDKEKTYQNIKKEIIEIQERIKNEDWKIKIAPEMMGKINVFGSIDEIGRLVNETKCSFCIDFAHILARDKIVDYKKINEKFNESKKWHCHFSGINYTEKGERNHIKTQKNSWVDLLKNLPKNKEITIINESPDMVVDSIEGLKLNKKLS